MRALEISQEEEKSLRIVIEDWETRTVTQRALSVAVLRDFDTFPAAAEYLALPEKGLVDANQSPWGILHDHTTGKLWIK